MYINLFVNIHESNKMCDYIKSFKHLFLRKKIVLLKKKDLPNGEVNHFF